MRSSPLSNRHKNNLSREGISPAMQMAIPGSHFGRATGNSSNQRRGSQAPEISPSYNFPDPTIPRRRPNQSNSLSRPTIAQISVTSNAALFGICLPQSSWSSLGDGWIQVTSLISGALSRAGLHTIVESAADGTFVALYDCGSFDGALTSAKAQVLECITSKRPKYNISIDLKAVKPNVSLEQPELTYSTLAPQSHARFMVTFATNLTPIDGNLTSISGIYVCGDTATKTWVLGHFSGVNSESDTICLQSPNIVWKVLREVSDESNLKPNIFVHLFLQIRQNTISVDANDDAIFTTVSIPTAGDDGDDGSMSGLIGLVAMQSKFVFKSFSISPLYDPTSDHHRSSSSSSSSSSSLSRQQKTNNRMGVGFASPVEKRSSPKKSSSMSLSSYLSSSSSSSSSQQADYTDQVEKSLKSVYISPSPEYTSCVEEIERYVIERINNSSSSSSAQYNFSDIAALDIPKQILIESVCLPLLLPNVFCGIRSPWKGLLLFGSPGTGKSMLARAIVNEVNLMDNDNDDDDHFVTFFNCTVSSILSKFRGESEKMIKCIFDMAAFYSPSIIFLDEVDAVLCSRGSDGEHEASRRIKSEILTQIDGVCSDGKKNVFVIAASNSPWDLDNAILRRLEKRIYIPLPDFEARIQLFKIHLSSSSSSVNFSDIDLNELSQATQGFSGADILNICREACMIPLRRLLQGKSQFEIESMNLTLDSLPLVTRAEFKEAMVRTKPSVSIDSITRLNAWNGKFGTNFK